MDRNQCLNFLKGLGSTGVVFIHITFPGLTGEIISKMAQFAVPVFFMITGYYALGCTDTVIGKRLIKILKIFMYGYAWFFAYNIISQVRNGTWAGWLKANYTLKALIKYVVFCDIDFAIPLWYLIAMAETYILWYFAIRGKNTFERNSYFISISADPDCYL